MKNMDRSAVGNDTPLPPTRIGEDTLLRLVQSARATRTNAYAPYSHYAVGAAVLADDGRIFPGCNVENAAYGATVCAERVAVWSAVAAGARRLVAAAVVTKGGGTPCGCCRQVLYEFGGDELVVVVAAAGETSHEAVGEAAPVRRFRLAELLPEAWGPGDLAVGSAPSDIYGIDHVQLAMPPGGEDRARAFYSGVLGLVEVPKPPNLAARGGAWFESGALKLHLGVEADFRPARKAHPALWVADLDELATRCKAAGHPAAAGEALEGYRRLYVDDPFGNRIELMERKADVSLDRK